MTNREQKVYAQGWNALMNEFSSEFTTPSRLIFQAMAIAWILCPLRRTITGIYQIAEPEGSRSHDAYHRFFRSGSWDFANLWRRVALVLVRRLKPEGILEIDIDDTLFHHTGPKVNGAGWWRDAVRSTGARFVSALGINMLVVTLRVGAPWGGEPLGLPVLVLLHRKKDIKLTDIAVSALQTVTGWFPDRTFRCCADGAYAAPLIPLGSDRISVVSRIQCNAALYDLPPERKTGLRGRPHKKGKRLDTPKRFSKTAKNWVLVETEERGQKRTRLVFTKVVLWYSVSQSPVLLVISRDPDGIENDDYFVCSSTEAEPSEVASAYAGRWSIEDTFRNVKQFLGAQEPQLWRGKGPERAGAFSFFLYSLTWCWYLSVAYKGEQTWTTQPWYTSKTRPSFQDAIALLRLVFWRERIITTSALKAVPIKIIDPLINLLSRAG